MFPFTFVALGDSRLPQKLDQFALAMLIALCGCAAAAAPQLVVQYEPAKVSLEGRLSKVEKFGPPGWGQDPDHDQKLSVPILHLKDPISVAADPTSELNGVTEANVSEVQVNVEGDYERFVGCDLVADGTLYHKISKWHFTPVVLTIEQMRCK